MINCGYCQGHGGAIAHTSCPVCGKVSVTDDLDICHICGSELVGIPPEGKTYCFKCGDLTINLPFNPP